MLLDGLLLKAVRWRRSRTIWCAAGVLAAGLYAGREQAQVRDDQNTSELRVTLLGLVTPPLVVSAERAQRECIELPKNPLDYEILGPHGDTVISTRCEVVETGRANGSWFPVKETWLDQLPGSYAGRIRHGVRIDPASLVGTAGFYGDADANCCPSQELDVNLTLRSDVLALSKQPLVRPVQK